MYERIDLRDNGFIAGRPVLPDTYQGIILGGAEIQSFQFPFGRIILQQFSHSEFSIRLWIFQFIRLVRCILLPPAFPQLTLLALDAEIHVRAKTRIYSLKTHQFVFLHTGNSGLQVDLKPTLQNGLLEISYHTAVIRSAAVYFPDFERGLQKATRQAQTSLIARSRTAGAKVLAATYELLDHSANSIPDEYQNQITDCLLAMMEEIAKPDEIKLAVAAEETERLQDLGEYIDHHLLEDFPIRETARKMIMNEMKFKLLFKKVFGTSVLKYIHERRMQKAMSLLSTTDLPIKAIGPLVGIHRPSYFLLRFKAFHGIKPSEVIRKQDPA